MNEIAEKIDLVLRILDIAVLLSLIFYIKKPVLLSVFNRSVEVKNQYEVSVFITTLCVVFFHFIGNVLARGMLNAGMDNESLVHIFYTVVSLVELMWMLTVIVAHHFIKCSICLVSRVCIYISPMVAAVHVLLYSERLIFGTKILTNFGRVAIISLNVATLFVLVCYVIYRVLDHLVEGKRV